MTAQNKQNIGPKAPPPPVTPGKSATKPCVPCAEPELATCDVEKLEVTVVAKEDNMTEDGGTDDSGRRLQSGTKKDIVYKVEVTGHCDDAILADVKDPAVRALLLRYDALIETIGQYPSRENPMASKSPEADASVELKLVRSTHEGTSCSRQIHPILNLMPLGEVPELKEPVVYRRPGEKTIEDKGRRFYAPDRPWDEFPMGDEGSLFIVVEIIRALFQSMDPKQIHINAGSCGRSACRMHPNQRLDVLLRIYRHDKWAIGLKIPPLTTRKFEKKADDFTDMFRAKPKGDYSVESSKTSGFGQSSRTESTERSGKTTTTSSELWEGDRGTKTQEMRSGYGHTRHDTKSQHSSLPTRTSKDGEPIYGTKQARYGKDFRQGENPKPKRSAEKIKERLDRSTGFDIVITRNEREVSIKGLKEKIDKWLKDFSTLITDTQNFFKKFSRVGWSFTFDLSLFAGSLILEWGPSAITTPMAKGRYFPVEFKVNGKISMEIVNISVKPAFGVEVQAFDTGLVLKIEGTISVKAKIEADINMDRFKPVQKFPIEVTPDGKVTAVGVVNALGYTVVESRLSLQAALEFKGHMEIGVSPPVFDLKGVLGWKDIVLSGYVRGVLWDSEIDPPKKLLQGGVIREFK
jgi:hypothetical protein